MPEIKWKEITEAKYWEMLEVLPPAVMTHLGFLVGEPLDHGFCPVTGLFGARFEAFAEVRGKYFVADKPMSVSGFQSLSLRDIEGEAS